MGRTAETYLNRLYATRYSSPGLIEFCRRRQATAAIEILSRVAGDSRISWLRIKVRVGYCVSRANAARFRFVRADGCVGPPHYKGATRCRGVQRHRLARAIAAAPWSMRCCSYPLCSKGNLEPSRPACLPDMRAASSYAVRISRRRSARSGPSTTLHAARFAPCYPIAPSAAGTGGVRRARSAWPARPRPRRATPRRAIRWC